MKKVFLLTFLLIILQMGWSQDINKLKQELTNPANDTVKLMTLSKLFYEYLLSYPDSGLHYVQQEIVVANKLQSDRLLIKAYFDNFWFYETTGDFPQALYYVQEGLRLAGKLKDWFLIARFHDCTAAIYSDEGDLENGLKFDVKAKSIVEEHWFPDLSRQLYKGNDGLYDTLNLYSLILSGLADMYEKRTQLDSCFKYTQILEKSVIQVRGQMNWSIIPFYYGNIYRKQKNYKEAIKNYHFGIRLSQQENVNYDLMKNSFGLAKTFLDLRNYDSAVFYANDVIKISEVAYNPITKLEALELLANLYKSQNKTDSVAKYFGIIIATKDSLFGQKKTIQLQTLRFQEQQRQQRFTQQQQNLRNKIILYSLLGVLAVFLLIAFILYRNNKAKQKANIKIENAYNELKTTQTQLIQSAKMASLGELTAGIAHEIQNPLNFVNNFSEVNAELINEMKAELAVGNFQSVAEIAADIDQNLQKINHHGKRADAIVKGMLQHSGKREGVKEMTDINMLCDEFLRLAYHGLRAKDKSFSVTMKTDFDNTIGKINIIPQDIGRVLLNLYNNAFYEVSKKAASFKPQAANLSAGQTAYDPKVSVTTRKSGDKIIITVQDNGTGIPDAIKDKIFQPFFTTKPTGQGTGLGLSLAYDIVKAHSGELKVESKEGEYAQFIVIL